MGKTYKPLHWDGKRSSAPHWEAVNVRAPGCSQGETLKTKGMKKGSAVVGTPQASQARSQVSILNSAGVPTSMI